MPTFRNFSYTVVFMEENLVAIIIIKDDNVQDIRTLCK